MLAYLSAAQQIALRWHNHPVFALYWLHQKSDRAWRDSGFKRTRVAVGNDLETWRKRTEAVPILLLGAKTYERRGTAVKVTITDDNFRLSICNTLDLIAPFAGQFYRRFNSF